MTKWNKSSNGYKATTADTQAQADKLAAQLKRGGYESIKVEPMYFDGKFAWYNVSGIKTQKQVDQVQDFHRQRNPIGNGVGINY